MIFFDINIMSNNSKLTIFRTHCKNCSKTIDLTNKNEKDKSFCDVKGENWWCDNCFEYLDFSFLLDDVPDEQNIHVCSMCNREYNPYSNEYFQKCIKFPELKHYSNNICSNLCLKHLVFNILPNMKNNCKVCQKKFSKNNLEYYFELEKCNLLFIFGNICSYECLKKHKII